MKGARSTGFPFPGRSPWWVSVLMAIFSYCALKYLVPELRPTNPTMQKLIQAAPTFAPLVTIPFLLLAAKQLYDSDVPEDGKDEREDNNGENPSV